MADIKINADGSVSVGSEAWPREPGANISDLAADQQAQINAIWTPSFVAAYQTKQAQTQALQALAGQVAAVQTAGHLFADGPLSGLHLAVRPNTSDEANWLVLLEMCLEQAGASNGAAAIPAGASPVPVEGSAPSMTYAQGVSAMNELMTWGAAVLGQQEALTAQINAATTVAAVQAISLATGWPS